MASRFSSLWDRIIARRPSITRLPRHLPDIITPLTEPAGIALTAEDRPPPLEPAPRWLPWALGAALLLHVLALAIALYTRERMPAEAPQSPIGVSIVFDHGGEQQATAPAKATPGPPQPRQSPAAPPPPPPPQAQPQEQVNLGLPQNPLADLPLPPPPPRPQPQPRNAQRSQPHPTNMPHHYMMMMNGMSYGSAPSIASAPAPHRALNLDLPQTDSQAVMGPQVTVKGDIGADWMAELNDWVNAHKYYPQAAAEQGQQGDVTIEFTVDRQGNVSGLRMLSGSGSTFLDQAWLGLFQGVQLPPFPPGTKSNHITVDATMHYILEPPTP